MQSYFPAYLFEGLEPVVADPGASMEIESKMGLKGWHCGMAGEVSTLGISYQDGCLRSSYPASNIVCS